MGKAAAKLPPVAKKGINKATPAAPNARSVAAKKRYAKAREEQQEKERRERESNKQHLQQRLLASAKGGAAAEETGGSDFPPDESPSERPPKTGASAPLPVETMPTAVTVDARASVPADLGAAKEPPASTSPAPTPPATSKTGSGARGTIDGSEGLAAAADKNKPSPITFNNIDGVDGNPPLVHLPASPDPSLAGGSAQGRAKDSGRGAQPLETVDLTNNQDGDERDDDGDTLMEGNKPSAPTPADVLEGRDAAMSSPIKKKIKDV